MPRRKAVRVVFFVLAVAAVALAGVEIARQWQLFQRSGSALTIDWRLVGGASALVMVAYALLIETWRQVVRAWGDSLPYGDAARIWFISNLGRYLPGKVWQIIAMGAMAQERGVSALAASGSAIVVNLVNLLAGFCVVAATGSALFDRPWISVVMASALVFLLAAGPRLLPALGRVASRVSGRELVVPTLPASAIWTASAGCVAAWLLYGTAFKLFVAGVMGGAPGPWASYVAAFTGSYLLGYIAVFSPGGLGVREGTLIVALQRLGLLGAGGAGVVSLASRLWLTALEVVPGVVLLAAAAVQERRIPHSRE